MSLLRHFVSQSADATLMIPDFSAKSTKKYIKLDPSSLQTEAAQVELCERLAARISQSEELQSQVDEIEQSDSASTDALQALRQLQEQQVFGTDSSAEQQESASTNSVSSSQPAQANASEAWSSKQSATAGAPFEVGVRQREQQNIVQGKMVHSRKKASLSHCLLMQAMINCRSIMYAIHLSFSM